MKPGRKSTGDLTIAIHAGTRMPCPPPAELTDPQAQVWRDVMAELPGDWFTRGSHGVLIEYCRRYCRLRLLESQIRHFQVEWMKIEGGLERFNKLLVMAARETTLMLACARALRLTPHARVHPQVAGRKLTNHTPRKQPWANE
jgi:phage terminase small subunit